MTEKHGLTQYRLNYAKDYAQSFLETVHKIEVMFQASAEGLIDEEIAEKYISNNIEELNENWKYFKSYIEQREDMR